MPTTAAVYLRLSEMTASTTSPERQRQACEEFVASRGWQYETAADTFEDWDRSAYSGRRRPGFERLIADLTAGKYEHLVVYRLDRLSRSFTHWGQVLKACQDSGAVIHSATEGIDSQYAAPVFGVLAGLAWSESSTISARVRDTREKQFAAGRWPGGNRPFGWHPTPHASGKGRTLVLHPAESQHLRSAIDRVIGGESVRSIVSEWNSTGVRTAGGRNWHGSRLGQQLRNPLLKGYRQERGDVVVDDDGMPVIHFPPLIDAVTFDRLQQALAERSQPRIQGGRALLAGVAKCGRCGGPLSGRENPTRRLDTYNCAARAARGPGACEGVSISQMKLDSSVAEWVSWTGADTLAALLQPEVATAVEQTLAEAQSQLGRWQELFALGDLTRARYNEKTEPLRRRIQEAEDEIAAVPRSPSVVLRAALTGRNPGEVLAHFAELPRRQQRELVQGIFEAVVVQPPTRARGMKGVARADRWGVVLRERVRVKLTAVPSNEFAPDELRWAFIHPDADDHALEDFERAVAADDRRDRIRGE